MREIDEPVPSSDEAVIEVAAFSVNRGQSFLIESRGLAWRPGRDFAGTVVREAANGEGPRLGSRVVAHASSAGWAQRVAVGTEQVATLPDAITFEVAAALPMAGLTAASLTRVTGPLASQRVLLTGASGGVGHYFVELASSQGAQITAVTASRERGARLESLGACELVRDVDDATGEFQIGLDSVGGSATAKVWSKLAQNGLLVWFGQASQVAPTLDFFDWRGGTNGSIRKFDYEMSGWNDRADLATLLRLVDSNRLHPEIGRVEDWSHTTELIDTLLNRQIRGNAVLTIPEE